MLQEPSTPKIHLFHTDEISTPKQSNAGVFNREQKQRSEEIKKAEQRYHEYQDKISNLTDDLYAARNQVWDEIVNKQKLDEELQQNEADQNSLKVRLKFIQHD